MGESVDRLLAWYDSFLCSPRLPAVVGEEDSDKIAANVTCYDRTRQRVHASGSRFQRHRKRGS